MSATKKMYVVHYSNALGAAEWIADALVKIPRLESFKLGESAFCFHLAEGIQCGVWELERVVSVPADLVVIFEDMGDGRDGAFIDFFRKHTQYWQSLVGIIHDTIYHVVEDTLYTMVVETNTPIEGLFGRLADLDAPPPLEQPSRMQDLVITSEGESYKANGQVVRFVLKDDQFEVGAFANYPLVVTMTLRDGQRVQLQHDWGEGGEIQHIVTPSEGREPHHFAEWGNPVLLKEVTIPAEHPLRKYFVLGAEPDL